MAVDRELRGGVEGVVGVDVLLVDFVGQGVQFGGRKVMPRSMKGCALFPRVAKGKKEGKDQLSKLCEGRKAKGGERRGASQHALPVDSSRKEVMPLPVMRTALDALYCTWPGFKLAWET